MRLANPEELKLRAFPVLTARVSEGELSRWFPFAFQEITDPEATPEPSKGALIKLASGPYVVVYWGELSKQMTLEIPETTDVSTFIRAFLDEVPLPESRITWQREDVRKKPHAKIELVSRFKPKRTIRGLSATIPAAKTIPASKRTIRRAASKHTSVSTHNGNGRRSRPRPSKKK